MRRRTCVGDGGQPLADVAGVAPVALDIQVAHDQLGLLAAGDGRRTPGDLAHDELRSAHPGLVVGQDGVGRLQPTGAGVAHQVGARTHSAGWDALGFGAALTVGIALITQMGEQADYRALRRKKFLDMGKVGLA